MKKLLITLNLLAGLPGIVLVPLAPFGFLLVEGEGRVPGFAHEYAVIALIIAYSVSLPVCIPLSLRARRRAFTVAALPLLLLALLVWAYVFGGVRLR